MKKGVLLTSLGNLRATTVKTWHSSKLAEVQAEKVRGLFEELVAETKKEDFTGFSVFNCHNEALYNYILDELGKGKALDDIVEVRVITHQEMESLHSLHRGNAYGAEWENYLTEQGYALETIQKEE